MAGNQTSVFLGSGGTRSFTYDAENRQIDASIPGMSAISYVYDGEGRRVQKTVGTTVTTFVYDAAGNLTAEYGPPSSVAGTTYLTADHLGSTRLVTNASGAPIPGTSRYDYAPFGEELTAGIDGRTTGMGFSTNQYPTVTPDGTEQKFTGKNATPRQDWTSLGRATHHHRRGDSRAQIRPAREPFHKVPKLGTNTHTPLTIRYCTKTLTESGRSMYMRKCWIWHFRRSSQAGSCRS